MLQERESKRFMGNSCLCQPKSKPIIKQFIQVDPSSNDYLFNNQQKRLDIYNRRNSHIIKLIDASNRNINSFSETSSSKNLPITVKFPVQQKHIPSISNYQPFPYLENHYDEIDPVKEETTTTYDRLRSYMPTNTPYKHNNYQKQQHALPSKNTRGSVNQISLQYQNTPPPPPPIQKLPKISRRQVYPTIYPAYSNRISPAKGLNKSISSIISNNKNCQDYIPSERGYLYEKWAADNNSSGYNSSQDISNQASSSSSSIISYCSINDTKISNGRTDMIDSGLSTLNVEDDLYNYDATENLSNYSNISPSSSSSLNDSYHEAMSDQNIQSINQHFLSPFPKIKTCMVAQIKKVPTNAMIKEREQHNAYENVRNYNNSLVEKNYSINDVLFSLKKLEMNNINNHPTGYVNCKAADAQLSPKNSYNMGVLPTTSTPSNRPFIKQKAVERDLDDFLCDEEVEAILSPRISTIKSVSYLPTQSKPLTAMYKINNKNIAIWEQLV